MNRNSMGSLVWVLCCIIVSGCGWGNDLSSDGILDRLEIQVEGKVENTETQKVDILWVVDNSVSMCQEQNSLATNVNRFLEKFVDLDLDLRMAVVTTDGLTPEKMGAFNSELAAPFPPNCFEKVVFPCLSPSDPSNPDICTSTFDVNEGASGSWICEPPPLNVASNMENPNGSVNSTCRYKCVDDADCVAQFGDPSSLCIAPGGDEKQRGCLIPPITNELCDGVDLPSYVGSADNNLDVFPCLAVVGASQDSNPQLEQGLNAAVWALSSNPKPGAPDRSEQARNFVRLDAYQVVIFISDEDDCSLPPGVVLPKELHQTCACLETASNGGELQDVGEFVNQLKSINPDPSKVLVAAIVGDVVVRAEEQEGEVAILECGGGELSEQSCVLDKQTAFTESKCGKKFTDRNTFVCESVTGKADFGSRYIQLVDAFGDNGFTANICDDEGFGPALDEISSEILTRIVRVCLPEPVKPGTALVVKRVSPEGEVEILEEGAEDGYLIEGAADCPDLGGGFGKAVFFTKVLEKGYTISLSYDAPIVSVD